MSANTDSLWFTTGNPFVDTGQEMMAAMTGVNRPEELIAEDVESLIPRLANLYMQEGWRKNLQVIFPNSKPVNSSVKKPREEYEKLLNGWLAQLSSDTKHLDTTCVISGKPADDHVVKVYLPMSDFGKGNFQSGNQEGVPVNASVALALQFAPLGLVKVGKMMALPHFSADEAQGRWAENLARNVFESEALGAGGVQEAGSVRPENALFRLVESLLNNNQNTPDSSVTLYLFNNFNQVDYKNATEIHYMPSRIFRFIRAAMGGSAEPLWRKVVWRGYVKKADEQDEGETLRKYSNRVYQRLLNGESISGYFVDLKQQEPVVRGDMGWRLFGSYQREVIGMDQRRIDSLRDLGDRIAPLVRDKHRRLLTLERADSRGRLTDVLYRLTKDATHTQKEPLITFEQLVSDVFPHDTAYSDWREVKYLLLFRIYEQLFDELKDDPEYANTEDEEQEAVS